MRAPAWLLLGCLQGCASTPPDTHYYQLVVLSPRRSDPPEAGIALAIEPLAVDAGYATERIAYRRSPYRLDYYHYHRWSSAPALLLADYLRAAYARSGRFSRVTTAPTGREQVTLSGRLIALEEVDESEARWVGRIELELALYAGEERRLVWSQIFLEEEPLQARSPEGLARALSIALHRITLLSSEAIARAAALPR